MSRKAIRSCAVVLILAAAGILAPSAAGAARHLNVGAPAAAASVSATPVATITAVPTGPKRVVGYSLAAPVTRVRITYWLPIAAGGSHPRRTVTLTSTRRADRADITTLVRIIALLPGGRHPIGSAPQTCPRSSGQRATLVFVPRIGGAVTATVDPACGTVIMNNVVALDDVHGRFWATVRTIVNRRCRCVPLAVT